MYHNRTHFFDISTSKNAPALVCFVHVDFQMCFAPQSQALFDISTSKSTPTLVCFVRFEFALPTSHFTLATSLFPHHSSHSTQDSTLHTSHSPLHAAHSPLHSPLRTPHVKLHTLHSTLHGRTHNIPQCSHSALHKSLSTLHSPAPYRLPRNLMPAMKNALPKLQQCICKSWRHGIFKDPRRAPREM